MVRISGVGCSTSSRYIRNVSGTRWAQSVLQHLLMSRSTVVVCGAVLVCAAWLLRYELVSVAPGGAYVLDRWTGSVEVIVGDKRVTVKHP
jgi:hypothetical protein